MKEPRGHLSMRPSRRTLDLLDQRARLADQPRTTLAERYLYEGLQMEEHPGIHFVEAPMGRRPAVMGTGLDVWEIVMAVKAHEGSLAEAAAYLEIEQRLVDVAMRYYGSNREEIDAWIARVDELNEREEAKWRAAQAAAS